MTRPAFTGLGPLAALALLAALAGCQQGRVYPLSPDAARSALVGSTIPDMAFGKQAHSSPGEATPDGVAWMVSPGPAEGGTAADDGQGQALALAARLTPVLGGVEISVDAGASPGVDPQRVAKARAQKPAVFNYFRSVAREQVDSVLTHRAFDMSAISADMALATVSMLPQIRQQADAAASASEQRDQDTIHRAYDEAGQGGQ